MNFLKNLLWRYFFVLIMIVELCWWGFFNVSWFIGMQTLYYNSLCLPLSINVQAMSGIFLMSLMILQGCSVVVATAFLGSVALFIIFLRKYMHISHFFSFILMLLLLLINLVVMQHVKLKTLFPWTFFKILLIMLSISLILQNKVDKTTA